MPVVTDALGRAHEFASPPRRIVSLVPSITETLFALGLGARILGVTEFCVHPASGVRSKVRVGGTKNPARDAIAALEPDLVVANKEENRRRDVERLEAAGLRVFVTYARTVADCVDEIRSLGAVLDAVGPSERLAGRIEAARAAIRTAEPRPRVAALIWKGPYMAVGADTYAHDLIEVCGGLNCFADADARYPRVDVAALERAAPDVILLPTEPYVFGESDRLELLGLDCVAARNGRIHVVEGELLSWYGPRSERALWELSRLLAEPA